jgi:hypothetical protein
LRNSTNDSIEAAYGWVSLRCTISGAATSGGTIAFSTR